MTPPLNQAQQDAFADALVSEIKAEMGRRDLSSRGLGRLIHQSSQYISMRLDGGNSKTGRRVALTISDIAAIASALDMEPSDLLARAQVVVSDLADNLTQDDMTLAADDTSGRDEEAEAPDTP